MVRRHFEGSFTLTNRLSTLSRQRCAWHIQRVCQCDYKLAMTSTAFKEGPDGIHDMTMTCNRYDVMNIWDIKMTEKGEEMGEGRK